ncbi:AI-2E family transporter [Levilactobacillus suantsaiihabitans]|uniref:AI-2E family transporter n=1 Tax=Levilactobacillus suantsaiihabitans TaxID=2487722 RepID=A0A4Z0J6M4_9LACO|nr:AI-2E family transporter [Levilactobacillus suantsaiihabitans]TGD18162.1 AI-2E family transporter [Levilactobacillus suantsaiihabitans]
MKSESKQHRSWFWNWVVNNRLVSILTITLLILLILLVLSKVPWLATPFVLVGQILGLPVILAGIGYYLMNPVVDRLERRGVRRSWTIIGLFIIVALLIAWGVLSVIPMVQKQTTMLLAEWPHYWHQMTQTSLQWLKDDRLDGIRDQLDQFNQQLSASSSSAISGLAKTTVSSVGGIVSRVVSIVVAVVTAPFILFYLLRDGHQLPDYLARLLPVRRRASVVTLLREMNRQVSNYVRGQLVVAFIVAVLFYVGFLIVGLKFALLLGIVAGVLNLVPYLGSFLAMIPAVVVAAIISPWMLVKVLIVFIVEQTLEGRIISPLVLGSSLKIHPLTIIFILLIAGKAFGVLGVVLGIPGYAVIRVVATEIFHWYQQFAGGYEDVQPVKTETGEDTHEED